MFYSQKMFWSARYPRRSPHPSRPHVGLDSVQYAPATMGTSKLRFSGSSSASMRQKYLRAASATGSGIRGRASNRPNQPRHQTREIGPSGGRAVRFDSVVQMILVPTRTDLSGLRADLWWKEEDYCTFRRGAVIESRAEISRNASRRRSLSSEITAKKEMDPVAEVAEVLRQMGNAQQSTRAVQQMKPHVAGPLRQPVTPPSSPARGGFRTTNNKRSVDVPSVREKDEWAYVEDFDGFVGADAHALKVC